MDLSNDLISKFVKITNDADKQKPKEGTVYGTAVKYDGGMYVKIDGSDLLTPVDTTADIQDGERVTITIKDHNATVTGNITSPSTNEGTVTKKVTEAVDGIEDKVITEVEILMADRVTTKELDAEVARIDELIAGKATIEDLTATNAEITNLKAKDAEIENLVADKATIEDLTATNARIDSLQANKADINYLDANFATIDELKATHAEIEILDAEVADINTLVNGNLTSDNILSFNITSQNTTMENAFVKDAMIDTVTANKIMSGTIDTNNVTIQSTDGSMLLQGTLLQMKDDNGKVRIQIGKDTGGNFTFVLYDESGKGVLIDEEGIKSSDAIADGLIVDAKVADNANISGAKLDIASVITEVNNDNSTTIKSSKIYLNEQNQSLEVAFNSLKTQVETIQDVTIDGDLSSIVEQVQSNTTQIEANKEGISTLVAENTIRKEEIQNLDGEIESVNSTLSSKYSSLEQDVSGFKTTVADTYTTKSEFNNLQIGGTNLIQNGNFKGAIAGSTSMPSPWTFWGNDIHIYGSHGAPGYNHVGCVYIGCNLTDGSHAGIYSNRVHVSKVEKGANYMASFILTMEGNVKGATAHLEYLNDARDQILHSQVLATARVTNNVVNGLHEHQYHIPFTMWTGDFSYVQITFNHGGTNTPSNGYLMIVGNVQIEKGNRATDWSPAPEDIQSQIDATNNNLATNYSTTSAMNSAIQQKANEITSSVSQTYTTKSETTAVQNQITTSRNLLMGSRDYNLDKWASDGAAIHDEWYNGTRIYATTIAWASMDYWVSDLIDRGVIELFTPYTFSCYVMSTSSDYTPVIRFFGDGLPNFSNAVCGTASTTWQRISITLEWSSFDNRSYPIRFEACSDSPNSASSYLKWACFQLERGRVATGWAPAPEDAQYAINDINNNLAANFSTTTQMNSAIQQKANEIISSVSETYISNYEAKKLADTTTTGLNKYLFERYRRDGFDYGTRPTLNDLVGARLIESRLVDSPPAHTSDLDNNYIGVLTFYLYYDYACTKTVSITTDDNGTVYLNNVCIYELTTCQPANVTFNMIKGINRIDIVYAEGGGGDGVSWGGVDGWSVFGAYANAVTNEIANRTNELTLAMTQGNMLYTDPTFRNGNNGTFVYNNNGNGTVTVEGIAAIEGCPNTSGRCLEIISRGNAVPGLGGFAFGNYCRHNAVFITKITAKIPVGYKIRWTTNSVGDNGAQKWLSTIDGTGNWHDYYCKVRCGNSGNLSNTNFFYLAGPQATAENPVTWYVSYATVFDVTDSDERITNLTNNLATNYSTTTQMNSAIDQKANEITSSVSQTYTTKTEFNNLEVGGTNLVYNGGFNRNLDGWNSNGGSCGVQPCTESPSGYMLLMDVTTQGHGIYQPFTFHDSTYCTDYVVSFYAKTNVDGSQMYVSMEGDPGTSSVFTLNGGWQKCVYKFRRSNTGSNALVFYANGNGARHIYIHSIKMEKGTVPSTWSPHPSEIENKVDNLSNNLANNYSTTVQMNSAIQQKANEITSSVSQSYTTKSEAAMMNDTVVGNRKWLFEQYTNNQNVGSGNGTYPTLAHLANETLTASRLVDSLPGSRSELGNNYLGVYTVYLYYESAYTWSGNIISDDESTTYLNGVVVCQAPTCVSTPFTMNFKKGINKLQIIHGEGGGGDGVTLSDLGPWKEYGAYPACVTAASSNYYASNSDIVQTVNDLTIKFTESGGYNLLQNGHGDKGTSYWVDNGGGLNYHANAEGGATGNFFGTSFPHGISYYDWVKLLPNTHYVYQAKIWSNASFGGNSVVPLHYWFSYDTVNNTGDGYTILDYQQNVSYTGTWTQCYLHFVTGNNNIYIKPFIHHSGVTTSIYVTELMLSQSRVVQPWSPHPSEVYSGITQIDKDGIRVQHSDFTGYTHMSPSGFYLNYGGTDLARLDAGGLYVKGRIEVTAGSISGTTLIDGNGLKTGTVGANAIAAGSITTDKLCVGDSNNYCQLTKGVTLTNRYGTAQWSGSGSHYYWSSSSTYLPFTVDGTRNPFKEGDMISFNLDIYCGSYAGWKTIGVWFYNDDNNTDYVTECCSSVEILAGWNNYKFDIAFNNEWVKAAKTIAILLHIEGIYTEVRNVVIRRKVGGELIVDGSITADKIAADAITGKTITGGSITGATISGGSINIGGNFSVNSSGTLTTNSQIYAQGGIYTYQDIRGLDDTHRTGGLTLVSGTGNVAVRTEAVAHSVYIQPASGSAYVTYPSSSNLADLHLKNLFSEQTNANIGNFGLAQLYAPNAYLEFMYGLGVVRVAEANHLYLQCGSSSGNTSTEVRCTCYKDPNTYTNIRAYNVCAQNAVYANGVNVSSDIARKRDIELYSTDALHEVCTTPVYTYHLDTDKDEELKRIGIIMQEAPLDAIDLTGKGVDLYQMVTMLWKATQQQQEMIEDLKQQLKGE